MRRTEALKKTSNPPSLIRIVRLSRSTSLLLAFCAAASVHAQVAQTPGTRSHATLGSTSAEKGSYAATYDPYDNDSSETDSEYITLSTDQFNSSSPADVASTTGLRKPARTSSSASSRGPLRSSLQDNNRVLTSQSSGNAKRSTAGLDSSDYMNQSDTSVESESSATRKPVTRARTLSPKANDADATNIYPGETSDAASIYPPAWKHELDPANEALLQAE
jgi:hypothetical protein